MNRTDQGIRYRVSIEPIAVPFGIGYATHRWTVADAEQRLEHGGIAKSRADAWQLALATLRGMIALARIRKAA